MDVKKKQKLLIEYLISDVNVFALCKNIIKPNYFLPEFRKSIAFINSYYDKYNTTPNIIQIDAETNNLFEQHQITLDQIEYCSNEIETFCKQRGMQDAILKASEILNTTKDYGQIDNLVKDAIAISLTKDLGISYFKNPLQRIKDSVESLTRISTGWKDLDDQLDGGLARTEILLVSANSGVGKSIFLANHALNVAKQGYNVLVLTLELSEKLIAQRLDIMLTGTPTMCHVDKMNDIALSVEEFGNDAGSLHIKYMPPGTNANKVRAYLKELYLKTGITPDLLVLDYLDLFGTNENISSENISEKDKQATEELRSLIHDYNMMCSTASQQNRASIEATELNQGHIAGGLTKINGVDWYLSIIMNSTMKAAGEIIFLFLKARSSGAIGKYIDLIWDNKFLKILNKPKQKTNDIKISNKELLDTKTSLKDIFDI